MAETQAKKGKVVKYVGTADVREIDAASWANVGAEGQKKLVWSKKNRFSIPASELTKEALAYVDNDDEGFVVVDDSVEDAAADAT